MEFGKEATQRQSATIPASNGLKKEIMQPATILPRNPETPIKQKKNADPPESIKKLHRHPHTKSYV